MTPPPGVTTCRCRTRALQLLPAAAVVLAVAGVYSNSFTVPFLFDDRSAILENTSIHSLADAFLPPRNDGTTVSGRPVVNLLLWFDLARSGPVPSGFHATNLLLHLSAGAVLFGLIRRTLAIAAPPALENGSLRRTAIPWLTTLLWLLHPLQTESVTYIVQRAEILGALFYLLTLYCLVRSATADRPRLWPILTVASCAIGMASKEVMVSAPIIACCYDAVFISAGWRSALRRHRWLHLSLCATWLVLAVGIWSSGGRGGTVGTNAAISVSTYFLTQCDAVTTYLRLVFWPSPLVFDYGTSIISRLAEVWWQFALLTVLFVASASLLIRRHWAGFLGVWFFCALAPTSSFLPVLTQTMAEHRVYLALAPVLAATCVIAVTRCGRTGIVLCLVAATVLGVVTYRRNSVYQSEEGLWRDTVQKRPLNQRAWSSLGVCYAARGDYPSARTAMEKAIELAPHDMAPLINYAYFHESLGDYESAWAIYQKTLRLAPSVYIVRKACGNMLLEHDDFAGAREHLLAAIAIKPHSQESLYLLATACTKLGRFDEALPYYARVMAAPGPVPDTDWGNDLALALLKTGRAPEALTRIDATLRRHPGDPKLRGTRALILLQNGRSGEAVEELKLLAAGNPSNADLQADLGLAFASAGMRREAIEAYQLALSCGFATKKPQLRRSIHVSIATLWMETGSADKAAASYGDAVRADPGNTELRLTYASALLAAGSNNTALQEYARCLAENRSAFDASAFNNFGVACLRLGFADRARACFKDAVKLDPGHADARINLDELDSAP